MTRLSRLVYIALVSALITVALVVRYVDPFFVSALRVVAFDYYQRLAPGTYDPKLPVRVVDIDAASLAKVGQWPWPRDVVAELVRRLQKLGAAAIAFDMVFPEPDRTSPARMIELWPEDPSLNAVKARVARLPDHDQALARAFRASGRVVAGFVPGSGAAARPVLPKAPFDFGGDGPLAYLPEHPNATDNLPVLDAAAAGLGSFAFESENDGVIRRVPLLYNVEGEVPPALSVEAVRVAEGARSYAVKSTGASGESGFGSHTGIDLIKVGRFVIPTDGRGRVWVDYSSATARAIPAWKVLGRGAPDLKGKIVFIGTSAAGLLDLRATPLRPASSPESACTRTSPSRSCRGRS